MSNYEGEHAHQPEQKEAMVQPEVMVVGAGVIGLSVALELQRQGFHATVLDVVDPRDMAHQQTSVAATGLSLAFLDPSEATGDNDHAKQAEQIVEAGKATQEIYAELAQNPHTTGIMEILGVELVADDEDWPEYLKELMDVEEFDAQPPVTLNSSDGSVKTYTRYYTFKTYSINTPKTLKFMADMLELEGGSFIINKGINNKKLDRDNLLAFAEETPVIDATGMGFRELADDPALEPVKGHSIIFRPESPVPPVSFSIDDLNLIPREDGSFIIGTLHRPNDASTIPKGDEATEVIERVKAVLQSGPIGPFSVDPRILDDTPYIHSAGVRANHPAGIQIRYDKDTNAITHASGFSGVGWSVGPGIAPEIVKISVEAGS